MARMREPYTGTIFEVAPGKVSARLASGWALLGGDEPEPTAEAAEAEKAQEQPAETPVATTDAPKPTAESTIAEIRAWAKANGVTLPKRGNKAALLAAIG